MVKRSEDPLSSLRDAESPVSLEDLKNMVLTSRPALFHLRSFLLGAGFSFSLAAIGWFALSPSLFTKLPVGAHRVPAGLSIQNMSPVISNTKIEENPSIPIRANSTRHVHLSLGEATAPIAQKNLSATKHTTETESLNPSSSKHGGYALSLTNLDSVSNARDMAGQNKPISVPSQSSQIAKALSLSSPYPILSPAARAESDNEFRYYASLQSGIIIGSLNTIGGGISLTFSHDWQDLTFRYTSTFGVKTNADEIFRKYNPDFVQFSQDVSEFAMMFGGTIRQGNFWGSLAGGPNIVHASFSTLHKTLFLQNGQPFEESSDIGGGLGASAQATFGYKLDDNFGLSFTGYVFNHSQTYGGLLLSLVGGKL